MSGCASKPKEVDTQNVFKASGISESPGAESAGGVGETSRIWKEETAKP
jgi:hypothetical protein